MNNSVRGKVKVLLIDDEPDFLDFMELRLASNDYEVYKATNGYDGVRIARSVKPDIILLDVLMPQMDGLQTLEKLKKDTDTIAIPVIMLSAIGDINHKSRAAQLYDELYLTKPVNDDLLISKIEEVILRRTGKKK